MFGHELITEHFESTLVSIPFLELGHICESEKDIENKGEMGALDFRLNASDMKMNVTLELWSGLVSM